MLDRMLERLDLTPTQQEQFQELLAENRDEHRALRETAKTARQGLSDQVHAVEFNEGAIREAAAAVAEIEEEVAVSRALMFQEVQQILTPEQQAQMREMMESLRDFHEEWGGRHRGRRGRK
jgi:Spy/CpxP family protein refolding chaperone